jgi:formiminoglutamase/agmatinase
MEQVFAPAEPWEGTASDPNDEQFGHVVEATKPAALDEYDAVLLGEPYDGAVISRTGAADAPAAIREALSGVKAYHFEHGSVSGLGDLGDVVVDNLAPEGVGSDREKSPVERVQDAVERATGALHASDAFPVFLGGDNSLTVPNVRPLCDDEQNRETLGIVASGIDTPESLGVVSFDAHLDCREPVDGASSGTPYRQLFDAGLDSLAVVGAHDFETSEVYADYLREQGGSIHRTQEVTSDPTGTVERALGALDTDAVYVSLDVDVLDDTAAPGVSAPTPGGLSTADLYAALGHLGTAAADAGVTLAGFEIVECAPPLDRDGRTVRAASRAVAHFLGGVFGEHAPTAEVVA